MLPPLGGVGNALIKFEGVFGVVLSEFCKSVLFNDKSSALDTDDVGLKGGLVSPCLVFDVFITLLNALLGIISLESKLFSISPRNIFDLIDLLIK